MAKLYGRGAELFLSVYKMLFRKSNSCTPLPENPKILLSCMAALGDLFLAGYVLESIRSRYPQATIGFLSTPESMSMVQSLKGIDRIHVVPSWLCPGRNKIANLIVFFVHLCWVYPRAVKEMGIYDIALELSPFFPTGIPLMQQAKISRIVGFKSTGFGSILSQSVPFAIDRYLPHSYPLLLESIGIPWKGFRHPICMDPYEPLLDKTYVVIHMGSSDSRKEWDPLYWKLLAHKLVEQGMLLVFTGRGQRDLALLHEAQLEGVGHNLIDEISISNLAFVIKQAYLVISIDSLPVHIAAHFQIPLVALYLYSEGVEMWIPEHPSGVFLINNQCHRRDSDYQNSSVVWLDEIRPEDVLGACKNWIGGSHGS